MPKVINITDLNNKAGKTTTIVNMATWLALLGKKTLIIDLDVMAKATAFFIDAEQIIDTTLEDVIIQEKMLDSAVFETSIRNLAIIPSVNMNEPFLEQIFQENNFVLRDYIDSLEEHFDYIFIDNNLNNSIFTKTALISSDQVIFLLKTEEANKDLLLEKINAILEIKETNNNWLEIAGIIFNFYTENLESKNIVSDYKNKFGNILYKTVIPKNFTISEAFNTNVPLALYDMKSFISDVYLRLVKEFLANNEPKL